MYQRAIHLFNYYKEVQAGLPAVENSKLALREASKISEKQLVLRVNQNYNFWASFFLTYSKSKLFLQLIRPFLFRLGHDELFKSCWTTLFSFFGQNLGNCCLISHFQNFVWIQDNIFAVALNSEITQKKMLNIFEILKGKKSS